MAGSRLNDCVISSNTAAGANGTFESVIGHDGWGGGIYNFGTLALNNTIVIGNVAVGGAGAYGETVGAGAPGFGGGILNGGGESVTLTTTGYNRDAFLKFDLGALSSVSNAKLRLFGGLNDAVASSVELAVHSAGNAWSESTLNWSNRPPVDAAALATTVVAGTTGKWYEIDLTTYLKTKVASGSGEVTLVLRSKTATSTLCQFNSDEAASSQPQLVIIT